MSKATLFSKDTTYLKRYLSYLFKHKKLLFVGFFLIPLIS
ncbi:MAG: hypothetical protein ACI9BD_001070, partial [Candidatus Marinamargulisbacteria bacterium]